MTFKILFDIRTEAEYRILTFKTLYWHSNWGRISHFYIQNCILTFKQGPNIAFWHSKSYFDIRTGAEYRILTFKILFWHSYWGGLLYFDIQNPILTFEIRPNIVFHHSKSFWNRAAHRILPFKILFDIWNLAEYRILTFKTLFWHSNWGRISHFDIQIRILTFEQGPNIAFWHSKSYFDIRTGAEYPILTFKILFWHSNRDRIVYFDIQNPILTFEIEPNIVFFVIQNPILTFELRPNIVFWHSKSYFDIQNGAEYCIFTFNILFWHLKSGRSILLCLNKTFTSLNWAFLTVHLALVAIATKSHNWTYQAKTRSCILVN